MYDRNLIELSFIGYIRATYFTYIINIFDHHMIFNLEKIQLIKAIKEDRPPNKFEECEINYILQAVNIIDYSYWFIIYINYSLSILKNYH